MKQSKNNKLKNDIFEFITRKSEEPVFVDFLTLMALRDSISKKFKVTCEISIDSIKDTILLSFEIFTRRNHKRIFDISLEYIYKSSGSMALFDISNQDYVS